MERALNEFRGNHLGGATACATKALDCFELLADDWSSEGAQRLAAAILADKPEMAPLLRICDRCLQATNGADLRERVAGIRTQLREASSAIAKAALEFAGSTIATMSHSGTIFEALRLLHETRKIRVYLSEGRPNLEGCTLAERLAHLGIPVTLTTDAALLSLLPRVDTVWIGADAVFPASFVNKMGSLALCLGAKMADKPVYVLADTLKFLPESRKFRERPGSEIWEDPPSGVDVVNPYFEEIPRSLVAKVICEQGPLISLPQEFLEPLQAISKIVF